MTQDTNLQVATFGAGCFWCVEAVFQRTNGVAKVESGYAGGRRENPTYEQVCSGATGHAEVVQVWFDPEKTTFEKLLHTFFSLHDPTTPNRQGADIGTQYRSVIFYHNDQQKAEAEAYIDMLEEEKAFSAPVVTEVSPFTKFYKAEGYHQDYYDKNPNAPYCRVMIEPKLRKLGVEK